MNSKKIISAILTLSFLATSIPLSVHASDANNEIYQETGQIIFDNLNVEVKDNELTYAPKMRSLSASLQQIKLDKELEKNPGFEDELVKIFNDEVYEGQTIVAVGYTRVYLKEVTENDKTHVEPMTVQEYQNSQLTRAGDTQTKGSLTLSVAVGIDNWDRNLASCYGYADWVYDRYGTDKENVDPYNDDFMTVSQAANFYLSSDSLSGVAKNGYRMDKALGSVVYGFEEATGRTSLGTTGRQQSQATVTREWSTKYVHTWESISPSFSISATGVGISGTPTDKSWQIVTYVAY